MYKRHRSTDLDRIIPAMIQTERIGPDQLNDLRRLWKADWLETHESDETGSDRAADEINESLEKFDFFASDSFWVYAARADELLVGYATVVRVPKLDRRQLFLFVDELFVLRQYRRRGIATLLLNRVFELGKSLGAEGVRLVVDRDNPTARALYASASFTERDAIFCEKCLPIAGRQGSEAPEPAP